MVANVAKDKTSFFPLACTVIHLNPLILIATDLAVLNMLN